MAFWVFLFESGVHKENHQPKPQFMKLTFYHSISTFGSIIFKKPLYIELIELTTIENLMFLYFIFFFLENSFNFNCSVDATCGWILGLVFSILLTTDSLSHWRHWFGTFYFFRHCGTVFFTEITAFSLLVYGPRKKKNNHNNIMICVIHHKTIKLKFNLF